MRTGVRLSHRQAAQILTLWLVGEIVHETELSTSTFSNDPLGITQSVPSSALGGAEHSAVNDMALPEPQHPSRPECSQQNLLAGTQELTTIVDLPVGGHVPYPSSGESPGGVDSMKPREDWDTTVSTLSPHPWRVNNMPIVDPPSHFTCSTSWKPGKLG